MTYPHCNYVQEEKPRFHNAQPGDLLWNDDYGICKIKDIVNSDQYPIRISSKIITEDKITLEGKRFLGSPKATFFYYTPENNYLTERPEPEVDWSKVPIGTKVYCTDRINEKAEEVDYFVFYNPKHNFPFWILVETDKAAGYKYCKLAEPIKPEWIKK